MDEVLTEIIVDDLTSSFTQEVIILGAGISGMLAAWACDQRNRSFIIVDKGPSSVLPRLVQGCVYLHDRCGLGEHVREQMLMTSVLSVYGVASRSLSYLYHQKIWGRAIPYEANSVDKYVGTTPIYSMNDALRHLHERYREYIMIGEVTWGDVQEWLRRGYKVVSTIPLGVFFPDLMLFKTSLWTWQSVMDAGEGATAWTIYNVDPSVAWYRMTSMFGNLAIEFIRPPAGGWKVTQFAKIASYDMRALDALHPNLVFTGRWGRWQRGFLSHETHREVGRKFDSGEWR